MIKFSGRTLSRLLRRFFKEINAPYRLTITNEESMSEALTVQLTKKSVYVFMSTVFVLIILLFSSLVLFTPLKYYIPGVNQNVSREKLIQLQKLADSLGKLNTIREAYIFNLIKVANGDLKDERDTVELSDRQIQQATQQNLNRIDHASRYDYLKSLYKDSTSAQETGVKDSSQKRTKFKEKN